MGSRLAQFFHEVDRLGGVPAKMRLASLTHMTSTEAAFTEDDPELIARFEHHLVELRAQFTDDDTTTTGAAIGRAMPTVATPTTTMVLRRHMQGLLELMGQRALATADPTVAFQRVDEVAAGALDVARVSVWLLDPRGNKISCADLFERATGTHSSGTELRASDHPAYFAALRSERTIAAHDAHTDPRTSCFSESYLQPLEIGAMLDVPIWTDNRMVGVICHEHVGSSRTWTTDDETFAYLMSTFLARMLESRD